MIEKRWLESDTVEKQQSPTKQYYEFAYEMHKIYLKKLSKYASSTKSTMVNKNKNICTKIITMLDPKNKKKNGSMWWKTYKIIETRITDKKNMAKVVLQHKQIFNINRMLHQAQRISL